ncbi:iron uptake system protein EfeO [Rathayibacter toxicus]|uniref:Lipoprotein n=1 Tax=Rathayibacter toxicus TaxID=145458 RepID=A0A0C5BFP5_9MICO|nr:iron uptake system protein EfeO [Rathayibacter toxicus]AJM77924.1 lipoprotein [Rathayibacter toxicus]ALS57876.1 hypothetical protein APU90_08955 [Rathayibacter toxicus]KKM46928.1 lipoprotein [Rathayibacter toxicus]PPG20448.1 peptidase M75 family protein [Rathayibacter toxicus]PPG45550.1 peptidase M75 family protein [Rathayibacter toxicus]
MSSRARFPRVTHSFAVGGALTLVLAGCVPNTAASSSALNVRISDDACEVSAASAGAGAVSFALQNVGSDVNEFEILADNKLRIVGEKENIAPGQSVSYVAQLEPGTYYTACKFRQVGATIGLKEFTVTGAATAQSSDGKAATETAVTNYVAYVKSQIGELLPAVSTFAAAYEAGDDEKARNLFASTRVFYERIEPTAEAFGDLDPKIDYREVDAVTEGLDWTGFHRIEKDLWPPAVGALNSDGTNADHNWTPSTPEQRTKFGKDLVTNVQSLHTMVNAPDFKISVSDISNGAISLLEEVAKTKITGEEDWWSSTDLSDFAANVQGAEVAFGNVEPIAQAKGEQGSQLTKQITQRFGELDALLAKYGSVTSGFVSYSTLTEAQKKELSNQVNALSEPLSQLTHTVLGVEKPST